MHIVTREELLIWRCRFRLLLLFMFIQQLDTSAGRTSVTHTQSVTSRVGVACRPSTKVGAQEYRSSEARLFPAP